MVDERYTSPVSGIDWGTTPYGEYSPVTGKQTGMAALSPDALAWVESLIEATGGEWVVPGAGIQTAEEWVGFLSTDQGKGWWGSLSDKSKQTLMPDYNVAGEPGMFGAAQLGSTPKNPVLSLPWLQGKTSLELPSAEHPYGYSPGGGTTPPSGERQKQTSFLGGDKSVYREGLGAAPSRVAPPARWLLF